MRLRNRASVVILFRPFVLISNNSEPRQAFTHARLKVSIEHYAVLFHLPFITCLTRKPLPFMPLSTVAATPCGFAAICPCLADKKIFKFFSDLL